MDLSLPSEALNWQRRAKAFAEEHLFPHEVELELHGSLPPATLDRLRRAVKEHGLNGVNHAKDVGGQGCSQLELTLIGEELGKATGALWAIVPHPAVALKHYNRAGAVEASRCHDAHIDELTDAAGRMLRQSARYSQ